MSVLVRNLVPRWLDSALLFLGTTRHRPSLLHKPLDVNHEDLVRDLVSQIRLGQSIADVPMRIGPEMGDHVMLVGRDERIPGSIGLGVMVDLAERIEKPLEGDIFEAAIRSRGHVPELLSGVGRGCRSRKRPVLNRTRTFGSCSVVRMLSTAYCGRPLSGSQRLVWGRMQRRPGHCISLWPWGTETWIDPSVWAIGMWPFRTCLPLHIVKRQLIENSRSSRDSTYSLQQLFLPARRDHAILQSFIEVLDVREREDRPFLSLSFVSSVFTVAEEAFFELPWCGVKDLPEATASRQSVFFASELERSW